MTRVIAGELGGRRLQVPPGAGTRPTSERTREALFSTLVAAHYLDEGPFLDLYAGSGAIGIEAISRGAPSAVFVERDPRAASVIRANLSTLGLESRSTVHAIATTGAIAALSGLHAATVFADPPYDLPTDELADLLGELVAVGGVHADGLIVVERPRRETWQWPAGIEALRDRRYGDTHLWYGRPL